MPATKGKQSLPTMCCFRNTLTEAGRPEACFIINAFPLRCRRDTETKKLKGLTRKKFFILAMENALIFN